MREIKDNKKVQSPGIMAALGFMWFLLAIAIVVIQFAIPPKIEIEWVTETEFETAGFNIYRSETEDGQFVRINDQLIPSQSDAVSGAMYTFVDENVDRGKTYYYRLEDIEYDNSTHQHELLTGEVEKLSWWAVPLSLFSGVIGLIMIITSLSQGKRNELRTYAPSDL
jgi:hypothetical protein